MFLVRKNHQTNHWVYDVFNFKFSIDEIDFQGRLSRPVRVKLRGLKSPKSWDSSHLDIMSVRSNIDGYIILDGGFFELPIGTQVGQYCQLELKYRLVREISLFKGRHRREYARVLPMPLVRN
jgi:hypothetical protein